MYMEVCLANKYEMLNLKLDPELVNSICKMLWSEWLKKFRAA